MIDAILDSPKHIFVTARAKSDTVITKNDAGRTVKTYGLKPEFVMTLILNSTLYLTLIRTHSLLVDKALLEWLCL